MGCSRSDAPIADGGPGDGGGNEAGSSDAGEGRDAGNGNAGNADAGANLDGGADAGASMASLHGLVIFDSFNGTPLVPASNYLIGIADGGSITTDGDGGYALSAPVNQPLLLLAELDGEVSVQRVVVVPSQGARVDLHNLDIDAWVGLSEAPGAPQIDDDDDGQLVIRFPGSGDAGAEAAIVGGGSGTGRVVRGDSVYFYNIAPGSVGITLGAADSGCVDTFAPGTALYPVVAGTTTEIVLSCPQQ